ncbi:MAG: hypothetical protein LBP86_10060 [Azoarcus sp.]|nr:hypothetical protein [Azoarcus sp.]
MKSCLLFQIVVLAAVLSLTGCHHHRGPVYRGPHAPYVIWSPPTGTIIEHRYPHRHRHDAHPPARRDHSRPPPVVVHKPHPHPHPDRHSPHPPRGSRGDAHRPGAHAPPPAGHGPRAGAPHPPRAQTPPAHTDKPRPPRAERPRPPARNNGDNTQPTHHDGNHHRSHGHRHR